MNKYFRHLSIDFFTHDLCNQLQSESVNCIETQAYSEHAKTSFDHIRVTHEFPNRTTLDIISNDCVYPIHPSIFLLPPNVTVPLHQDNRNLDRRNCTIVIPLYPEIGYSQTHWYNTHEDDVDKPIATCDFTIFQPTLLNIQEVHGNIKTGDKWRATVQLSVGASYDAVVDAVNAGKLFRTYNCKFLSYPS